tara:strand:+ start:175 stop:507 length:333 start_codon:yes stop_codon:yes gene_type:complete
MAIFNSALSVTGTTILTVPANKRYAVTTILVCNHAVADATGANDTKFDMHIVPSGGAKANANQVLNQISVAATDTFTFNVERIILDTGDFIILTSASPANLSATVSYLEV